MSDGSVAQYWQHPTASITAWPDPQRGFPVPESLLILITVWPIPRFASISKHFFYQALFLAISLLNAYPG
jgi:hypothetical protein